MEVQQQQLTSHKDLIKQLAENAADSRGKLAPEKPQLQAEDPTALRKELGRFKAYMVHTKVMQKSVWFSNAKAVASGRAETTINTLIQMAFGSEQEYIKELKDSPDAEA